MASLKILLGKSIFTLKILGILQFKYIDQDLVHVVLKKFVEECNYMVVGLTDHFSIENFKVFLQVISAYQKYKKKKKILF